VKKSSGDMEDCEEEEKDKACMEIDRRRRRKLR
jgi:hypothetical protein